MNGDQEEVEEPCKRECFYLKRLPPTNGEHPIIPFKKNQILIGRAATCDYKIVDEKVSRNHALFKRGSNVWTVKNLSTNGVFVNENALPKGGECVVDIGSTIQIGQPKLFFFRFGKKDLAVRRKRLPQTDGSYVDGVELISQQKALEERLCKSETAKENLLQEKEELQSSLREERQLLQERFTREHKELEEKHSAGVLAQQTLLEEKVTLAQQLHRKVEELQQRMQEEKVNLEQRLKEEEENKRSILEEKEEIASKLQAEKKALERQLIEDRKELEEKQVAERQLLQQQLLSLEEKRLQLQQEILNKEQCLRKKEEQQQQMEEEQRKTEETLLAENQELLTRMKTYESNLEEKILLTSVLEGELVEKQEVTKRLDALMVDKISLERQLKEASEKQEQVSHLEEALGVLEAQKLSLEQEVAFAASVTEHARKQVVETVSNVVENEFQCPICSELFITAIMLNCSHTFCKFCIDSWKKTKRDCPNCRTAITSETRSIVVDNFIEKIVETLSEDMKNQRQQTIKERTDTINAAKKKEEEAVASASASVVAARASTQSNRRRRTNRGGRRGRGARANARASTRANPSTSSTNMYDIPVIINEPPVMEVVNVEDSSDMSISSNSGNDSDTSSSLSGVDGVYYGGYGHCYNCGRRGHWANGCPDSFF